MGACNKMRKAFRGTNREAKRHRPRKLNDIRGKGWSITGWALCGFLFDQGYVNNSCITLLYDAEENVDTNVHKKL